MQLVVMTFNSLRKLIERKLTGSSVDIINLPHYFLGSSVDIINLPHYFLLCFRKQRSLKPEKGRLPPSGLELTTLGLPIQHPNLTATRTSKSEK